MSNSFNIKISEVDMAFVRKAFSEMEKIGAQVTMRAVNRALDGVKTDASKIIREYITVSKKGVDKTFKTSRASVVNPTAWIASTGKPVGLIDYSARQTDKGVSVQVRRNRPRKIIPGTFIATMKNISKTGEESNHEGVFWRVWHGKKAKVKYKKPPAFLVKSLKRQGFIYNPRNKCFVPAAALPHDYRFKIRERFGPRIPDYMGEGPIMKTILSKAGDRLHKNLMHEMEYELSKLK